MYCKNCGNEIKPGDRFCRSCGAAQDDPVEVKASETTKTDPQDNDQAELKETAAVRTDPTLFAEDMPEKKKKSAGKTLIIVLITVIILALAGGTTAYFYFFGVTHGRVQVIHFGKESRFNLTKDELVQTINKTITDTTDWLACFPDVPEHQKTGLNDSVNSEKREDGILERFTNDDWREETKSDTETAYICEEKGVRPEITIVTETKSGKVVSVSMAYSQRDFFNMNAGTDKPYRVWQAVIIRSCDSEANLEAIYSSLGTLGDPLHNYRNSIEKETISHYIHYQEKGNNLNNSGLRLQFAITPTTIEQAISESTPEGNAQEETLPEEKTMTAEEAVRRLNGSWETEDTNTFITRFEFVEGHLEYVYESYRSKANQLWFEADYDVQMKDGSTAVLTLKNIDNKGISSAMPDRYDKPLDFSTLEVDFTETEDGSILINGEKAHQTKPAK